MADRNVELAELVRKARDVLARAAVISEARASSLDSGVRRLAPTSRRPVGQGRPIYDEIAGLFRGVSSIDQLRHAVKLAEDLLHSVQHSPRAQAETVGQFRARVLAEHAGRHYLDAALIEHVSGHYVRKIRKLAGLDPMYGRAPSTRSTGS